MADRNAQTVVIRRVKKVVGGGHHGGAWKVAFADFATAMMAFFLLMWLIAATTKEQRGAIAEYFNNPSMIAGHSTAPSRGMDGPGGASTSLIKLGSMTDPKQPKPKVIDPDNLRKLAREDQRQRLESLMKDLRQAIDKSQALEPFKDQLLLDITPAGLRIQIVDKQNRPMFDSGGTTLKPYTVAILRELAKYIATVPNRISIAGHTDAAPYVNEEGYTNWELSADRANAARRELEDGGLGDGRVAVVVGLGSSVLFDKRNPMAPINRRISIVVLTPEAEAAVTEQELPQHPAAEASAGPATPAATRTATAVADPPPASAVVLPAPVPAAVVPAKPSSGPASASGRPQIDAARLRAALLPPAEAARAAVSRPDMHPSPER